MDNDMIAELIKQEEDELRKALAAAAKQRDREKQMAALTECRERTAKITEFRDMLKVLKGGAMSEGSGALPGKLPKIKGMPVWDPKKKKTVYGALRFLHDFRLKMSNNKVPDAMVKRYFVDAVGSLGPALDRENTPTTTLVELIELFMKKLFSVRWRWQAEDEFKEIKQHEGEKIQMFIERYLILSQAIDRDPSSVELARDFLGKCQPEYKLYTENEWGPKVQGWEALAKLLENFEGTPSYQMWKMLTALKGASNIKKIGDGGKKEKGCFNCKLPGHFIGDCRKKGGGAYKGDDSSKGSSSSSSSSNKEEKKSSDKGKGEKKPRKFIPKEIFEKRRKDGVCFKCGKDGHRIVECPAEEAVVAFVKKEDEDVQWTEEPDDEGEPSIDMKEYLNFLDEEGFVGLVDDKEKGKETEESLPNLEHLSKRDPVMIPAEVGGLRMFVSYDTGTPWAFADEKTVWRRLQGKTLQKRIKYSGVGQKAVTEDRVKMTV